MIVLLSFNLAKTLPGFCSNFLLANPLLRVLTKNIQQNTCPLGRQGDYTFEPLCCQGFFKILVVSKEKIGQSQGKVWKI